MSNKRKSNRKGKGRSPKHNKHLKRQSVHTRPKTLRQIKLNILRGY